MNQCPFIGRIAHYDPCAKFASDEMLRDISESRVQCILPYGHVGKHVCRDGADVMEFPNKALPTEQGILLEWTRRKEAGQSTEDLENVLGLGDRLGKLSEALGVKGAAARRAIARELAKRSATTDDNKPRPKRLIKI
jgi:hypothetical protein